MKQPKFKIIQNNAGQYDILLVAANGRVLMCGNQGYRSQRDAARGIDAIIDAFLSISAPLMACTK